MIHVVNYFRLLGTFFFRFWDAVFSVFSVLHHFSSSFVYLCSLGGLVNPGAVNVTFKNCISSQCFYHASKK